VKRAVLLAAAMLVAGTSRADPERASTDPIRLPALGAGTRITSTLDAASTGNHDGGPAINTYLGVGATVDVGHDVELWGLVPVAGLPITDRTYMYGPDLGNVTVGGRWLRRTPREGGEFIVALGGAVALPTGPERADTLPMQTILDLGAFEAESLTVRAEGDLAYVTSGYMLQAHAVGFHQRRAEMTTNLRFGAELGVAAGARIAGAVWATAEAVGILAERDNRFDEVDRSSVQADGVLGGALRYRGRAFQAGLSAYFHRLHPEPMVSATVAVPL
jgi:hypothetical protein